MRVILKESYMNLGEAGEVVDVRPGYARNFLIPQKLAVSATNANLKLYQDKARELEKKRADQRDRSKGIQEKLQGVKIEIKTKVSDDGRLFGSISTKLIEEHLNAMNIAVDRRQIILGRNIKMVGAYEIQVKLVGGLTSVIPLTVASDKVVASDSEDSKSEASTVDTSALGETETKAVKKKKLKADDAKSDEVSAVSDAPAEKKKKKS